MNDEEKDQELKLVWGDIDWGTSDSNCIHRNFPCEFCGADIGTVFKDCFYER